MLHGVLSVVGDVLVEVGSRLVRRLVRDCVAWCTACILLLSALGLGSAAALAALIPEVGVAMALLILALSHLVLAAFVLWSIWMVRHR